MRNTQFFNLPLFDSADHPSFLTDWNSAMETLDNSLETIRGLCETNEGEISGVYRSISDINNAIGTINTTVAGVISEVSDLMESVDTINTADLPAIRTDIIEINQAIITINVTLKRFLDADIISRVGTLETNVSDAEDNIASLQNYCDELNTHYQSLNAFCDNIQQVYIPKINSSYQITEAITQNYGKKYTKNFSSTEVNPSVLIENKSNFPGVASFHITGNVAGNGIKVSVFSQYMGGSTFDYFSKSGLGQSEYAKVDFAIPMNPGENMSVSIVYDYPTVGSIGCELDVFANFDVGLAV